MCQELVHHTPTTNMAYYIDEATPIDTTPIDNTANPPDYVDAVSLYPDPIDTTTSDNANPQDGIDVQTILYADTDSVVCMSPKVDVKLRKGEYIITVAKTNTNAINLEQCLETAMKKIVLMAFKKETKPRPKRRKTIVDMTPEQIEKARQQRLDWYRKNKDRVREYTKEKYNTNYDFWKKTSDYARERYRTAHANVEKQKPGRKPRSSSNSGDESHSPPPVVRSRGRPRINPINENKEKKPPGRPLKVKFFTSTQ